MRGTLSLVGGLLLALLVSSAGPAFAGSCQEDWPTFQRDFQRTGSCGPDLGPGTGEVLWTFTARGIGISSTPAVVDGVVYFGSDGEDLYAVNATSGDLIWQVPGVTSGVTSPTVADGHVTVAGGITGNITTVDAETGRIVWRHDTGANHTPASVTVADGVVYAGTSSNTLHALDAADGHELWNWTPGPGDRDTIATAPTIAEDQVIVGSTDNHIYALRAEDGTPVWTFDTGQGTGDRVIGAPVLHEDLFIAVTHHGTVHALDVGSGEPVWTAEVPPPTGGYLTLANELVYVTSIKPKILALDANTGKIAWEQGFGRDGFNGGVSVSGQVVYANGIGGGVYALDALTGEKLWQNTNAGGSVGSPSIANGVLYVGSEGFHASLLYAVDAGAGLKPSEGGRYEGEPVTGQQDPIPGGWTGSLIVVLAAGARLLGRY